VTLGALLMIGPFVWMVPGYITLVPQFVIVRSIPFFGGNDVFGQGGIGWLNS
jgi:multiple sugar transport system permease protein